MCFSRTSSGARRRTHPRLSYGTLRMISAGSSTPRRASRAGSIRLPPRFPSQRRCCSSAGGSPRSGLGVGVRVTSRGDGQLQRVLNVAASCWPNAIKPIAIARASKTHVRRVMDVARLLDCRADSGTAASAASTISSIQGASDWNESGLIASSRVSLSSMRLRVAHL
jgi:hypothetical protein